MGAKMYFRGAKFAPFELKMRLNRPYVVLKLKLVLVL